MVVITLFSSDATKLRSNVEQVEPKNTFISWKLENMFQISNTKILFKKSNLLFIAGIEGKCFLSIFIVVQMFNCEAQGKGRATGRPRKVTQRSFIDGGWWISFP